ncbi:MAG: TetR family transcriptional regulator [Silvanigrellales bacterium]|jgi:TetR/AcrR family transcriptional regulator|nr:TetR family transcriptional regulator [Silvanigrellales bacterium]
MKKRAIQFEDKENKRKQIVIAARELFTVRDFFFVKMEDVATKAGVAKGTLYLYFGTKEELFLAVAETEIGEWFESLYGAVEDISKRSSENATLASNIPRIAGELSTLIASTLKKHPTIPRDLSLLFNILEHNVSDDKMLAFKSQLIARLDALCEQFTRMLGCHEDACWRLQLGLQSIMLGAWQLAKPSEKAKALVLSQPGISRLSPSFDEFLEWCVKHLVAGFLAEPSSFSAARA